MDVLRLFCAILLNILILSEVEGFRFKLYQRYTVQKVHYTPYAYNNYILYSPNKGWSQDSVYAKYVPKYRTSSAYEFYNGHYSNPIRMYKTKASDEAYKNRRIPEGVHVCANYEENQYGDVMGVFSCPNVWEPRNYTSCCGYDYAEFCCDQAVTNSSWQTIVAIVAGILAGLIIIIIIIVCCVKKRSKETPTEKLAASNPKTMNLSQSSQGPMYPRSQSKDDSFAYSSAQ